MQSDTQRERSGQLVRESWNGVCVTVWLTRQEVVASRRPRPRAAWATEDVGV